jgi:hypothetical protein
MSSVPALRLLYALDASCLPLAQVSLASCLLHTPVAAVRVVSPAGTALDPLQRLAAAGGVAFEPVVIAGDDPIWRLPAAIRPYFYCVAALQNLPPGRHLLLDADTLCVADLSPLTSLQLDTATPMAACSHGRPMVDRQLALGLATPYAYFNAGVLMLEAQALADRLNSERVVDYYERHALRCRFREQCVINALMAGAVAALPLRYNLLSWMRRRARRSPWQQLATNPMAAVLPEERSQAAVVHLSNGCLPTRLPWWSHDAFDRYWLQLARGLQDDGVAVAAQQLDRLPLFASAQS